MRASSTPLTCGPAEKSPYFRFLPLAGASSFFSGPSASVVTRSIGKRSSTARTSFSVTPQYAFSSSSTEVVVNLCGRITAGQDASVGSSYADTVTVTVFY